MEMVNTNDLGINIQINAGKTPETSSIRVTGSVLHVITDSEINSFGLNDRAIKNAVGKYLRRNPDDCYVRSPTPHNDLYKTYGWQQVTTVLNVESASITGVTSQPTIVSQKTFINSSPKTAIFNAALSYSVANTAGTTWSNTYGTTFEQSFHYEIGFLGTGGGGSTTFGFSAQFGRGGENSQTVTLGSSDGVQVELAPNESVVAVLTASRGVLKARITYTASLTGSVAVRYKKKYKGKHFYSLPVADVMKAAGISSSRQITQDIEVGYYSNGIVQLQSSGSTAVVIN